MANRRVNVTHRDATGKFRPVELTKSGKIPQPQTRGVFYLDWRQDGKRRRKSVGTNAEKAYTQLRLLEHELAARAAGVNLTSAFPPLQSAAPVPTLSEAVRDYLSSIESSKKQTTLLAYTTALNDFLASCSKATVTDITQSDMLKFAAYLRDVKNHSPRSVRNKFAIVVIFLNSQGHRGIVQKNNWPEFTEETPKIYEREDLDPLFAACTPEEREWFEFFLMTGMRKQEVVFCSWPDVNFDRRTVAVRWKKEWGWQPKKYKERFIPLPDKLFTSLKARKARHDELNKTREKKCNLIFPTRGCRPKRDFIFSLKVVAKRAGLDESNYWLHRFRATFATRALRANVDLRTLQEWMGHTDIKSTMRYLRPAEGDAVRAKVNAVWA